MTITYAEAIITGSMFSCTVLLLRFVLQKRLPNVLFYWMWNAAGLLLLLPFRIPSPVNILLLMSGANGPDAVEQGVRAAGSVGQAIQTFQSNSRVFATSACSILEHSLSAAELITLSGSILIAGYLVLELLVWKNRLCGAEQVDREISARYECISRMPILTSAAVNTPCVRGIFKTRAYFPADWDFSNQMGTSMALYHERTHVRHQDNLRKAVLLLLLCLQWYNPVVWLVYFFACRDMELYCDECVVEHFGRDARSDYALMLLSGRGSSSRAVALGVCLSKRVIRERIVSIMKPKGTSTSRKILSSVFFVILVLLFSADATSKVKPMDTAKPSIGNPPGGNEVTVTHYNGLPLALGNGDILVLGDADGVVGKAINFSLTPVEGYRNGQTVSYGYLENGVYRALGILNISDGTVTTLPEAKDTNGTICIRSSSPDTIYINDITVKIT